MKPRGYISDPDHEDWDDEEALRLAKVLYEGPDELAATRIAVETGLTRERVLRRALSEQWRREGAPEETPGAVVSMDRQQAAAQARAVAQEKWAELKADEAEAAAETLGLARDTLNSALRERDVGLIKATTDAYTKVAGAASEMARAVGLDKSTRPDASGLGRDQRRALLRDLVGEVVEAKESLDVDDGPGDDPGHSEGAVVADGPISLGPGRQAS